MSVSVLRYRQHLIVAARSKQAYSLMRCCFAYTCTCHVVQSGGRSTAHSKL